MQMHTGQGAENILWRHVEDLLRVCRIPAETCRGLHIGLVLAGFESLEDSDGVLGRARPEEAQLRVVNEQ
eukprot:scaffold58946_cov63-Phaeocystis_antarctica.AAC.11